MSESQPTNERLHARPQVQHADAEASARAGGTADVEVTTELPTDVVDALVELADNPDEARDLAHDHVEHRVEFTTPDGQRLEDVVGE